VSLDILEDMTLDFKTPFDELTELRAVLTTQEIAELTGLRRETISRARPDGRFQRRTEKALRDLYLVVAKMRLIKGDDTGQLAAVLRRPQAQLGDRSIAELLRDGKVEVALESLSGGAPAEAEGLLRLRLDPETDAKLARSEEPSATNFTRYSDWDRKERVTALLEADHELQSRLGAIEAAIVRDFGPRTKVERKIVGQFDESEGEDDLYLRVYTDLPFAEEIDRLAEFRHRHEDLLTPVRGKLVIGFLG
jgi:hypothetical protein